MGKFTRYCGVKGCGATETKNPDLKFHCFPRTTERCLVWVNAAGNEKLASLPLATVLKSGFWMCSQHFSGKQYAPSSDKLAVNAILDLLLPTTSATSPTDSLQSPSDTPNPVTSQLSVPLHPSISSFQEPSTTLSATGSTSSFQQQPSPPNFSFIATSTPLPQSTNRAPTHVESRKSFAR